LLTDPVNRQGIDDTHLAEIARAIECDGYVVLPNFLSDECIQMLQAECEEARRRQFENQNPGLSKSGRLFAPNIHRRQPALRDYLFSDAIAALCAAALGSSVYFFLDQMIVQPPDGGLSLSWHQDSGYVVANGGPPDHAPYLSIWAALDPVSRQSGTLIVQPGSHRDGIRDHQRYGAGAEFVVANGPKGIAVEMDAGGIVLFSSLLLHATSPNHASRPRRAYLAQFTPEVMLNPGTLQLRHNAVQVVRDGQACMVA